MLEEISGGLIGEWRFKIVCWHGWRFRVSFAESDDSRERTVYDDTSVLQYSAFSDISQLGKTF